MKPPHRRIGILTGGGDVPGLNVALKAVVTRAEGRDVDVLGLRRGWLSLLEIDPDDPSLVRAGLSRDAVVHQVDDEPDVLFHAHCFPTNSPVWVRR